MRWGIGAGFDDPIFLPPAEIQVHLAQAHRIGLGAAPIGVGKKAALAEQVIKIVLPILRAGILQRHEAILHQPCVGVESLAPGMEAVIGDDDQRTIGLHGTHHVADIASMRRYVCSMASPYLAASSAS